MSKQRPSYPEYRAWLGLDGSGEDTPVEVLARTGGGRGTDTFHVVDDLQPVDGHVVSRFLASGVRHIDGAAERVAHLRAGQRLYLRDEPENPVNQQAILIDAKEGLPVAHVPDWLIDDVHALRDDASEVIVTAERINEDASACSDRAEPSPAALCHTLSSGEAKIARDSLTATWQTTWQTIGEV